MNENVIEVNSFNFKDRMNYLFLAIAYTLAIPFANIVLIFKPLYSKVYYSQSNDMFYYGLSIAVLVIEFLLIELVLRPKLKVSLKGDNSELPLKNTIILFVLTFGIIFIVSAIIGFHIKPFYDLGNNTSWFRLMVKGVEMLYLLCLAIYMVRIIASYQFFLDGFFKFKNEILNKYFPYGGICAMLFVGSYFLIAGYGTMLYIFIPLIAVYGVIYLLANRSFYKAFASILLIMVL